MEPEDFDLDGSDDGALDDLVKGRKFAKWRRLMHGNRPE